MHSMKTNRGTEGLLGTFYVGPKVGLTKFAAAAATIRSAMTVAVLSALLLIAARPAQATQEVLYNFTSNPDGANPGSSLISYNGNFYGTTYSGGLGYGTVFELSPNGSGGWVETVLYEFCSQLSCTDGENPTYAYLTVDGSGNLYGTTFGGGANGYGAVFELTSSGESWTETVLYSFANSPDGANPVNGLIMDTAGHLYGTTWAGGTNGNGTVFEMTLSGGTWTEAVISNISSTYAGLTMHGGNIYGIGYTTVFQLSPNGKGGWIREVIHNFIAADAAKQGSDPNGTPVFDSAGNLYGTTETGGTYGYGVVYKLTPGAAGKPWAAKLLASLGKGSAYPLAGVVFDSAGNLYGTATQGGAKGLGCVFELVAPAGGVGAYKEKVIWNFDGENGNTPDAGLFVDTAGNLYGTTYLGGSSGYGSVFVVNPAAAVTTTTMTSSLNPSISGQSVTFTATVTSSAGAPPDGEVVVFEPLGQSTLSGGVATWTTSTLAVGKTNVRAVYEGDLDFITSMSAWLPQIVKQ